MMRAASLGVTGQPAIVTELQGLPPGPAQILPATARTSAEVGEAALTAPEAGLPLPQATRRATTATKKNAYQ